jgi:hypothetical protein
MKSSIRMMGGLAGVVVFGAAAFLTGYFWESQEQLKRTHQQSQAEFDNRVRELEMGAWQEIEKQSSERDLLRQEVERVNWQLSDLQEDLRGLRIEIQEAQAPVPLPAPSSRTHPSPIADRYPLGMGAERYFNALATQVQMENAVAQYQWNQAVVANWQEANQRYLSSISSPYNNTLQTARDRQAVERELRRRRGR